ncbi:MAG TPA: hypothetical protein VF267_08615, partial [Gammaproteobacteria bacterium]
MKSVVSFCQLLALVFFQQAIAAEVTVTRVPGMAVQFGDFSDLHFSQEGRRVVFETEQSLVVEDTNDSPDAYVLDLEDGSLDLLLPQPGTGRIDTPAGTTSFNPVGFSNDGSRLAMTGSTDWGTPGSFSEAIVVFDFIADTYFLASVDESGTKVPYFSEPFLSGNGRYVFFQEWHSGANWPNKYYRHDLLTGATRLVLDRYDGGYFVQDDISLITVSEDGNRMLVRARDETILEDDQNEQLDYFVIDLVAGSKVRVNTILADGSTLANVENAEASPDFEYIVLEATGATSTFDDRIIDERFVVYDVSDGTLTGLLDFLAVPEHLSQSLTDSGPSFFGWGGTSRHV